MIEELRSGIDYLTVTLPRDAIASALWYGDMVRQLVFMKSEGYELKERSMLGYRGYSCGNCFVGERETDYMCQWTGHHADRVFQACMRPDVHVSRIDVQVTVKLTVMDYNVAREAYDGAMAANEVLPLARRRKIYIICGSDGGDTLYVGAPSSEIRARLYNKEVQSEDTNYTRCWRYECVFRNDNAAAYAKDIYQAVDNRVGRCEAIVAEVYRRRGIRCGWVDCDGISSLPIVKTLPSDVERRLWWLENQVKPAITSLLERGYRDKILAVLGLSEDTHGNV